MSLHIDFQSGAKEVLDRVMQTYGFTTKLALAEHLGIASSSLANRYARGYFPSDIVIRCMADTGASLAWLAAGQGECPSEKAPLSAQENALPSFDRQRLESGKLIDLAAIRLDPAFLAPLQSPLMQPLIVQEGSQQFVVEQAFTEILDGDWMISLEGQVCIRTLTRIPPGRVRVAHGQQYFECSLHDITPLARVVMACRPVP